MPIITEPEDSTRAQWDALRNILVAEMQAGGRLTNCAWTDAAGNARTSSIVDVRRNTEQFFTTQLNPDKYDVRSRGMLGVQLLDWNPFGKGPDGYASTRYWLVTIFQIRVAVLSVVQSVGGEDLIGNADDALSQAWSFISDGNGNGISSILRDPNNRRLKDSNGNPTCNAMSPGSGKPTISVGEGDTPQIWAFIDMVVRCEKPLSMSA